MSEPFVPYYRIRIVKTFNAGNAEVTNDLPHLHGSSYTVAGFQPGNPGSNALGSFTIKLHPPGSEGFAAAWPIYRQIQRYQRAEYYVSSDGASLGKMVYAGVITGRHPVHGEASSFDLTGVSDIGLANLSRPFPGELLSNDVTSNMIKSFLGTNELGWTDTFNPFTAGNYTSTSLPGFSAGTWTADTDDNMTVVKCSTGSGAILIAKTGAQANDRWNSHFVEVSGRLVPSADLTQAGQIGIGITNNNANLNDGMMGFASVFKDAGGRYELSAQINGYSGGSASATPVVLSTLTNVDDPQGVVPFTIGALITTGGNSNGTATLNLVVNGKIVLVNRTTYVPGTATRYPVIAFTAPNTGSATAYFTNLIHMTRFSTDGPSTAATFANGTISAATHSLAYGVDPGPNFLETWSGLATREGWYWRYTPKPYVVGTRTLGTVDFMAEPGTDYGTTKQVVFSAPDGSLLNLDIDNNSDPLAPDTAVLGQATPDGGGLAYWRDITSMTTYGVIQDEVLAFTHSDFNRLRRAAFQINANKIKVDAFGAKTAVVVVDSNMAFAFRELDKVMIHDPELEINYQVVRVIGYTFQEGKPTMTLLLDQYSENFIP